MRVAALGGGVGGAKLLVGLQQVVGEDLTAIVNTGDDASIYGVHVSPDVDIVTYWLAGIADRERGWGIHGDTFQVVEQLRSFTDAWFSLGDRDFATCIYRTRRQEQGAPLSLITDEIRCALGVVPTVLPMSDDPVRTRIVTADGETLDFQDYFVRLRQAPEIRDIRLDGVSEAKPAPGVIDAIAAADVVIVCPSNPLVSIAPILSVHGVREAVADHPRVVAVSPLIGGRALKGPADRMMRSMGHEATALGVARLYGDVCNTFIVDRVDAHLVDEVRAVAAEAIALDTIMNDLEASARVAREILEVAPA